MIRRWQYILRGLGLVSTRDGVGLLRRFRTASYRQQALRKDAPFNTIFLVSIRAKSLMGSQCIKWLYTAV